MGQKRYMIIYQQVLTTSISVWEGLALGLSFSSLEQRLAIVYLGDSLYQLLKHQDPSQIGVKDYSCAIGAYPDYGIDTVYVLEHELEDRGLQRSDLLIEVSMLTIDALRLLMQRQDAIFHV